MQESQHVKEKGVLASIVEQPGNISALFVYFQNNLYIFCSYKYIFHEDGMNPPPCMSTGLFLHHGAIELGDAGRKSLKCDVAVWSISRNGPFLFGFLENEAMGAVTAYIFHIKIHSRITGEKDLLCVFISFFSIVLIFFKNP
jgi:hypothetical protein